MKNKQLTIEVPQTWLDKLGEANFKIQLQNFLEEYAPCEKCIGAGFVTVGSNQAHMCPDDEERGCQSCNADPWENPL